MMLCDSLRDSDRQYRCIDRDSRTTLVGDSYSIDSCTLNEAAFIGNHDHYYKILHITIVEDV